MEATAKGVLGLPPPPPLLLLLLSSPPPPPLPLLMVGRADHTRASREAQAFAKPRAFFRKVYAEKRVRGEVPPTPLPLCDSHSPMKVRRRSPRRRAPLTWGKKVGKEACREATMDAVWEKVLNRTWRGVAKVGMTPPGKPTTACRPLDTKSMVGSMEGSREGGAPGTATPEELVGGVAVAEEEEEEEELGPPKKQGL